MSRRLLHLVRLVAVPALLVLGTMTAPAASAGNPCFHGYVMSPATTGPGTDVELLPCSFEPTVATVAVGAEVTFRSGANYTHLITGANQSWGSRDVELQPNSTVSYTFDEPGIYPYACALHVGMSGTIVVGDPGEAAAGSTIGSTTGGSTTGDSTTGTSANDTSGAAANEVSGAAAAPGAATAAVSSGLPLVGLGAIAGLIVGAGALWLAIRRRSPADRSLVHAE